MFGDRRVEYANPFAIVYQVWRRLPEIPEAGEAQVLAT